MNLGCPWPRQLGYNLCLEYNEWDQRADALIQGFTYDSGEPVVRLEAEEQAVFDLTLASDNSAPGSGSLILRLVSDETGVRPWGNVQIEAKFTEAEPYLYATPHFVESGVLLDDMATETVILENKGLADLEGLTLTLIGENNTPVPDWPATPWARPCSPIYRPASTNSASRPKAIRKRSAACGSSPA